MGKRLEKACLRDDTLCPAPARFAERGIHA